jgi:hypothetical protein
MSEILQSINEQIISTVIALIHYLLAAGMIITGLVVILVIYGNTLSTREDVELYLNGAEQVMMASEQQLLVRRMDRLAHVIFAFAAIAAILVLASAGLWLWIVSTS